MVYNEKLTNRARYVPEHLLNLEEMKMFRGITFMVNEKMCISVGADEIMCHIAPELHEAAIVKNGCRSVVMKGWEYPPC